MKELLTILIGVVLTFVVAGPAMANTTLFSDNFNSENGGNWALNYNSFTNWDVTDGSVDLIGGGTSGWDWFSATHGLYVDMDGTTSPMDAGKMTTKTTFDLEPGLTYILSFELAGNQRSTTSDMVMVQVGNGAVFNKSYSLETYDPFTTFMETFSVASATSAKLSFEGIGGDNIGMLLDNVNLSVIPAPGGILLGCIGAGLVGWLRRRRTM